MTGCSSSAVIDKDVDKRHRKQTKAKFDAYIESKVAGITNCVLDQLPSPSGIPLSAYLNRILGVLPLTRRLSMPQLRFEECLTVLSTEDGTSQSSPSRAKFDITKAEAIRLLCRAASTPPDARLLNVWLTTNAGRLNQAIANSLDSEGQSATQTEELCYGIAYLVRSYHFQMYTKLDLVLASLVRALAEAMLAWEVYVETYRQAKDRHSDLEISRGRTVPFHFPDLHYSLTDAKHGLISCIYYTIADLVYHCPSPKLIHFFECRIFRRKEMTRNLLLKILAVVVNNLNKLRNNAAALHRSGQEDELQHATFVIPTAGSCLNLFEESAWAELPANLYIDIVRVYNEHNRANKDIIHEIMAKLRGQSSEQQWPFDESALKAMELYMGTAGAGPIGRPTNMTLAKENDTIAMRSKCQKTVPNRHDSVGKRQAMEYRSSLSMDVSRLIGTSRQVGTTDEISQKSDEMNNLDKDGSSDSYDTENMRCMLGISRRTIVAPKLADLFNCRTKKLTAEE